MGFTLDVQNFRCLETVHWRADGVCALVGPNGAGKTTLLDALRFLSDCYQRRDMAVAAETQGGATWLRREGAGEQPLLTLRLETAGQAWRLSPSVSAAGFDYPTGEQLWAGEKLFAEQHAGARTYMAAETEHPRVNANMCFLPMIEAAHPSERAHFEKLVEFCNGYRAYNHEALPSLRTQGSQPSSHTHTHPNGYNAFAVLRNWATNREFSKGRAEWVKGTLRQAFPGRFEDYDFESSDNAMIRFYDPRFPNRPLPPRLSPDGLLVGLLHVAAVASCPPGGAVAIDEFENGLHPHAIRALIDAIRARARELELTVILTTHSPTVLNCFDAEPEKVFVIERSSEPQPRALPDIKKKEWLAHFALGDLYAGERIGGPQAAE